MTTRSYPATRLPANSAGLLPSSPTAPLAVLIGGSNTLRLTRAFEEMGKSVESLVASGWTMTLGSIDSLLANLAATLSCATWTYHWCSGALTIPALEL